VTYTTLMVHLELGRSNAALLKVAASVAETFHAGVIGIAACQPMRAAYSDAAVPGEIIEQDRDDIAKEIEAAESEFRSALDAGAHAVEWRSGVAFGSLSGYLAHQARCADLVVTCVDHNASAFDSSRHVNMGDLVMQAGRPVLIVPAGLKNFQLRSVVVGWKETREARRAIFDALPLLKKAERVTVVEIAKGEHLAAARLHLADVVNWLKIHGTAAEIVALLSTGDDAAQLKSVADEQRADVVVAGAYGHGRLREWALGGVTRDLLLCANRCSFVSH
jgi:nucleotide-binding universal stress UspA family protein